MAQEIEHRFLLPALPDLGAIRPRPIAQGYASTDPALTARIRREGDVGTVTFKGPKTGSGCAEFEQVWPLSDVIDILRMCKPENIIEKDRYVVPAEGTLKWEIDVFKGRHAGLVVAEIELPSVDARYDKPEWLRQSVDITKDFRFANAQLTHTSRADLLENIKDVLNPAGITPPDLKI